MNTVAIPESVVIARPDQTLIQSAAAFLASARQSYAVITTGDMCEAAGEDLKAIKGAQKRLEDSRTTITKPLLEAQRAVNALFKGPTETLTEAERIVKRGILGYQETEERKRREAEAAAAEVARKEREKLEAQAARAANAGKLEKAEVLQAAASAIPERVEIASAAPKIEGLATRSIWRAEVTDKGALVRYVAERPEWLGLLEVNMTALSAVARAQKDALAIPGVKAVEERLLASRSS